MQPQVLDGYRVPRSERPAAKPSPGLDHVPEGKKVFHSHAKQLRVQLTSPLDVHLPDGRKIPGRPLAVVFMEKFKVLDLAKDATTITLMLEHPGYGVDFWDYEDELATVRERKVQETIAVLGDPEARAAIIQALRDSGEADFELPKAKAPKASKDTKAASDEKAVSEK